MYLPCSRWLLPGKVLIISLFNDTESSGGTAIGCTQWALTVILGRWDTLLYWQVHLGLISYIKCDPSWAPCLGGENECRSAQQEQTKNFASQDRQISKVELSGPCRARAGQLVQLEEHPSLACGQCGCRNFKAAALQSGEGCQEKKKNVILLSNGGRAVLASQHSLATLPPWYAF